MTYHVVGGQALSTDLADGQKFVTLNGAEITVTINTDGVFINNAKVTVADILADNGVVHVIDAVLLPPPSSSSDVDNNLDLTIIPNPAVDMITIKSDQNTGESIKVDIFTISGQNVLNAELLSGKTLDISHLNSGIYMLNIKTNDSFIIKKLVKH